MKIKIDLSQLKTDCQNRRLELYEQQDGSINLSAYISEDQPNTQLADYINLDVSITYNPDTDDTEYETYGNPSPIWLHRVLEDIKKVIKANA
jgi:hypothetical protein